MRKAQFRENERFTWDHTTRSDTARIWTYARLTLCLAFCFRDRIFCIPGWPLVHYKAEGDSEILVPLCLPPKCSWLQTSTTSRHFTWHWGWSSGLQNYKANTLPAEVQHPACLACLASGCRSLPSHTLPLYLCATVTPVFLAVEPVENMKVALTNLCLLSPEELPQNKLGWRQRAGDTTSFVSHLKKEIALNPWN